MSTPAKRSPSAPRRRDAYACVAEAIDFLVANAERSPGLEETAAAVGLSPAHFQRVFKAGAGVSPKRFLQHLAAGRARRAIEGGASLLDAALEAGLSGPSRLHDLFLVAEAMTPGAYRKKGAGLTIRHATMAGPFGAALIGATGEGICWLSFAGGGDGAASAIAEMKRDWPAADFVEDAAFIAPLAARAFRFAAGGRLDRPLGLCVQGTNFQLKVWEALLAIPFASTATYGDVARALGAPQAARAVGAAVGANSISLLIPCHRVLLASGAVHNYRWGAARKQAILSLETAIASP